MATAGVDKVVCLLGRSIFDKHPREHDRFPFAQYAEWLFRPLIRKEDVQGGENGMTSVFFHLIMFVAVIMVSGRCRKLFCISLAHLL